MEYEHIAIECMHPLNVIRGWSLQQHTTGYHRKKVLIQSWQQVNLLKQVFWHWMSHLSESMAMTSWSAMSFTILSVFELVNQVDTGLKWLTIQEHIQSYKSFQLCHSLVCEIHKAHPSQFFTSWLCKSARPADLYAFHICLLVSWFCSHLSQM